MIEVEPLVGAGPVKLGATRDQAGEALRAWGEPQPYAPYPGAEPLDWRLSGQSGVDIMVSCASGTVDVIEIYGEFDIRPRAQVSLLGHDVFAVPAGELVEALRQHARVEVDDGFSCTIPSLSIGLWRPNIPDASDAEEVERYTTFNSILLAGPGYYS